MAARIGKIAFVGMVTIWILALSCGQRHETGPDDSKIIGSIQVTLTPGQLRLPSPEAVDSALIEILVLDSKGVGLPDIKVNLTRNPEIGHITQPDSTDSLGQTTAWFVADPGVYDTTRITAGAGEKTASALLTISEAVSEIGSIIVALQKGYIVAGGEDSSSINVTVLDTTGSPIRDGTGIYFSHTGTGFLMASQLATVNGQVRNRITSPVGIPLHPGPDSIFVSDAPGDTSVVADTAVVRYIPGQISHLEFVYPESSRIMFTHTDDTCSVLLSVTDANGNPIFIDTPMTFDHTLPYSTLTPQPPDTIYGYVRNIYQVGEGTGDDNVTAWIVGPQNPNDTIRTLQPVIFRCLASEPAILLLDAARDNIIVGGDSTNITATLLYANGDTVYGGPIPEGYDIDFEIVSSPGCSFDQDRIVTRDTIMTNIIGQAVIQFFSGSRSGSAALRACTVPLPPDSLFICDEQPLVTIMPGPPRNISIAFSYYGESIDPNLPDRYVQVAALVYDQLNNPVQYGTPVRFGLIPNDIGEIDSLSYTGGARPYHSDSTAGVAYSRIIYDCLHTFDFIRVIAAAGDPVSIIDTSAAFPLPIYEGEIDMVLSPDSLWTPDSTCASSDTSDIRITLTDGGGCPIEGGIITFAAQIAGEIIGQNIDTTDADGHAYARFQIRGCDIPRQPDGRARLEAQVKATLAQKTTVFAVQPIICTRP